MYQIKCDNFILYDPRDDDLILRSPKCKLEVNKVGEASFTIFANHPYYGQLKKMRSVFEISQGNDVIFRGRMTDDSHDFNNFKFVDLEGVMAYFNDSIVRPFSFPDDFLENAEYITAKESGNVIEFFLKWLIDQHNAQVQEFQRFKLGEVTVSDPNNYLSRSNKDYSKTWETLRTKLFESALGGYFCIRYEHDGNYIDYLADFELTNTQKILYGENLRDLTRDSDASETYSAIIPLGKKLRDIDSSNDSDSRLTIAALPDGDITDDIVKAGDTLYSKSAVEAYGYILAPPTETTWDDVSVARNLQKNGTEFLVQKATRLLNTIQIKAVDLHYSDKEIASFRIYRYVHFESAPHGQKDRFKLTKLDIDILNPKNTNITLGDTSLSLTDINANDKQVTAEKIADIQQQTNKQTGNINELRNTVFEQSTSIMSSAESIIFEALESYVETGNYEEFKSTVEAQFQIMADQISMNFTATTEQITDVDGDLQSKFTELYKYIQFSEEGITIGDNATGIVLGLDNDMITFSKNGFVFGKWDGNNFYTGNIIVEVNERAQFGNFAFIPRSDGSLSFLKVSG